MDKLLVSSFSKNGMPCTICLATRARFGMVRTLRASWLKSSSLPTISCCTADLRWVLCVGSRGSWQRSSPDCRSGKDGGHRAPKPIRRCQHAVGQKGVLEATEKTSALSVRGTFWRGKGMKILLAQINTTVGDVAGNEARILAAYQRGVQTGVDLVLFPELTTTGYPPRDLLLKPQFVSQNLEVVHRLAEATGPTAMAVGFVGRHEKRPGR